MNTPITEEQLRHLREDLLDSMDEEFELELDDRLLDGQSVGPGDAQNRMTYFRELLRLQS